MNASGDASADTPLTRVSASADTYIRDTPLLTPPADTPLAGPAVQLAALASAIGAQPTPCQVADADLFFDGDPRRAVRLCRHCHAMAECRALAIANGEQHGVWGGHVFERRSKLAAS